MSNPKSPENKDLRREETPPTSDIDAGRKPSIFKRAIRRVGSVTGDPKDWFGRKSISSGAGVISTLWRGTRNGSRPDRRFKVQEGGDFDITATAFSYGISVEALERRLEQRRRMTIFVSYGALLTSIMSVFFWIHSVIHQPYTLARIRMAWEFFPFISLFLLLAFYYALLNFQIRKRRSAGWREFLSTEEGFLPR